MSPSTRRAVRSGSPVMRDASPRSIRPAHQGFAQQARGFGFQPVAALDMARQAGVQIVEVEEFPHEGHLVEADLQKPQSEVDKCPPREVAAPIIALTRRIGTVHPSLVFPGAVEAPGETARHRPQAMGADPGLQRHGVAHETAHPAIAVREGMNVIQPVMRGRHGQDARRRTRPLEAIAPLEMRHERFHGMARRRDMGARDIPGPRVVALDEVAVVAVHQAHEIGEVRGGRGMQPGAQGRLPKRALRSHRRSLPASPRAGPARSASVFQ